MQTAMESPSALVSGVRHLARFVGWLSGALVGVTGLLYVIGYIARSAHSHFLGLDSSGVDFEPLTFLATGADASIRVMLDFGVTLFSLSLIVFLLPIWAGIRATVGDRARFLWRSRVAGFCRCRAARHAYGIRIVVYSILFGYVFFLFYDRYVQNISVVFGIADLLHDPDPLAGLQREDLRRVVLCASDEALRTDFAQLIMASGVALLVTAVAWRTAARLSWHYALITPFVILLVTLGYVLSAAFGVLLLGRSFSPVELTTHDHMNRAGLYLIDRTATQLILWDPTTMTITSLPDSVVTEVKVGKPRNLIDIHAGLAKACRQPG